MYKLTRFFFRRFNKQESHYLIEIITSEMNQTR